MNENLNVSLVLKLIDRISGPFKPLLKTVDTMKKRLGGVGDAAGIAGRGVARMSGGVRTATGIFAGYTAATTLAASQLVQPAAKFESFMATLTALEGSGEKAREALDWVRVFATNTPLQIDGVLDSYRQLKTFGIDPMSGSLQSIVDMNSKLGGGQERLSGIILAVGQAWTKQKLQGEEALQLIERGVPVWDILSKALGKSTVQVQEMASAGELGRREIQLLMDAMGDSAKGAAALQMTTWNGMISNLTDLWSNFQLAIMQNGLFDWMKGRLSEILSVVNEMQADGRLEALAIEIGQNIQRSLEAVWELGKGVVSVMSDILPRIEMAKDFLGGWNELAMAVLAVPFASTFAAMAQGIALVGFALVKVSAILIANPIGPAVAALAGSVYLIYQHWDGIAAWFTDKWDLVRAGFKVSLIDGLILLWRHFNPLNLVADAIIAIAEWLTGYKLDFAWTDIFPTLQWPDITPPINWIAVLGATTAIVGWFRERTDAVKTAFRTGLIDGLIALWTNFSPIALVIDGFVGLAEWLTGYRLDFAWTDIFPTLQWPDITPPINWIAVLGATTAIVGWFRERTDAVKTAFRTGLIDGLIALWTNFSPIALVIDGFVGLAEWLTGYRLDFAWADVIPAIDWGGVTGPTATLAALFEAKFQAVKDGFNSSLLGGLAALWREFNLVAMIADTFAALATWLTGYRFEFSWSDLLPTWSWSDVVPDLGDYFRSFSFFGGASGPGAASSVPSAAGGPRSGSVVSKHFIEGSRALGGPVMAGRMYQVNERGIELFQPDSNGRIISAADRAQGNAQAAPTSITVGDIHVYAAPGQNPVETAQAVRAEMMSIARQPDRALHDGGL